MNQQVALEQGARDRLGEAVEGVTSLSATIDFGREAHVYDVRRGIHRRYRRQIEEMIHPARARLHALLPYEVRGWRGRLRRDVASGAGARMPCPSADDRLTCCGAGRRTDKGGGDGGVGVESE